LKPLNLSRKDDSLRFGGRLDKECKGVEGIPWWSGEKDAVVFESEIKPVVSVNWG
jgi:hypothetical protein